MEIVRNAEVSIYRRAGIERELSSSANRRILRLVWHVERMDPS